MSVLLVLFGATAWAVLALGAPWQSWLAVRSVPREIMQVVVVASVCVAGTALARQLLTGLGDLSGANASLLCQALVVPVAVVAAVLSWGVTARVALSGYMGALAAVLLSTFSRLGAKQLAGSSWDSHLTRPLVTYGLRSQAGTLALMLAYRSDLFLVDHALGPVSTGVYSVALTLSEVLRGVPETSQALVLSRAVKADLAAYVETAARRAALVTTGAGVLLAAASHLIVPLVFGRPYAEASVAFACLVPGVIGLAVSYTISPLLFLQGQVMVSAAAALAALAALWTLGLYGPGTMSLVKIATASSVAYWVLALVQIAYLCRKRDLRPSGLVPRREDLAFLVRAVGSLPTRLISR
jgi:O-antigen/teichoic acid export membrane protein